MEALVKYGAEPGSVAIQEVPTPKVADDEVLINVAYGAVCGTDRAALVQPGDKHVPRILGHEASGVVESMGSAVDRPDLTPGVRVTFETDAYLCMRCPWCRKEEYNRCPYRLGIGTTTNGALAAQISMPERAVHRLPDSVSLRAAALTEPLAVSVHGVLERSATPVTSEVVVITGPGAIGQLTALTALAAGAVPIVVGRSRHADKLAAIRNMGVSYTVDSETESVADLVNELTGGLGAHTVFECSGSADVAEESINWLIKGGQLMMLAFYPRNFDLDANVVVNREVSVMGSRGKRASSYRTALRLMGEGRIDTEMVIGIELPLAEWQQGMDEVAKGTKVVFEVRKSS